MTLPVSPDSFSPFDSVKTGAAFRVRTYNRPQALELVLRSLDAQSPSPSEIIVADDGSNPETARLMERVLHPTKVTWCHVRHKDPGFRQGRGRNLGASHSRSPHLINIDHDTVA